MSPPTIRPFTLRQVLDSTCLVNVCALLAWSCDASQPQDTSDPPEVDHVVQELTFVESSGIVSIEAEHFTTDTAQGSHSWAQQNASGASGGVVMDSTPDSGAAINTGYVNSSPRLNYQVTFASSGSYRVWVRGRAGGAATYESDSLHVGLNGAASSSSDRISGFTGSFGWSQDTLDGQVATINVPNAGTHTVNVWMREDGFDFDKLVLAKSTSFVASGNGPAETASSGGGNCTPATYEAENISQSTGGSAPDGWNIWSNGNVSTNHTFTANPVTLRVTARGSQALDVWPNMIVSVGGSQVGQVVVNSATWTQFDFPVTTTAGTKSIAIAFNNDYYDQGAGQDRNLYVDKVQVVCPDVSTCTNGNTRPGTSACGLNSRGVFQQLCVSGYWQNTATCLDPDECTDDDTQPGTTTCGLNGRGLELELCEVGSWADSGICDDPDECTDDDTQPGITACGLNGRGVLDQTCNAGSWVDTTVCQDSDVCLDDDTQPGSSPCGLNGRGTLDEVCLTGQWQDSAICQDPDVCTDGSTQPGSVSCGLNGRGAFQQSCDSGNWSDTTICLDPDECLDGASRSGPSACGLNGRGTLDQTCESGNWTDTTTCQDSDVCTDGTTQPGSGSCGLNGRGTLLQACVTGQWQDSTSCDDPDECLDASTQAGSTPCGINGRGALDQVCSAGIWTDTSTCQDPDVCVDDATRPGSTACGLNSRGTLDELCLAGQWQDSSVCQDPDECVDNSTQPGSTSCGINGRGVIEQLCTSGSWGETTTCLDPDECSDGATQPGTTACGFNDRGTLDQVCVAGNWEDSMVCADPDECTDDDTQAGIAVCGLNGRGFLEQVCIGGLWEDGSVCLDPDECLDDTGQAGTTACGLNDRGTLDQVCIAGTWEDTTECVDPDACLDDDVRPGATACGLNGRGTLDEVCVSGQWQDGSTCQDPDVCVDDDVQEGTTPCGNNGSLEQSCVGGEWHDSANCVESDFCGDEICSSTENCSSCAQDCGTCPFTAVWLEAEQATMSGSPGFATTSDGSASSGAYISPTSNNTSSPGPNRASFSVELQAGTYRLWVRARAPSADDDSMWVSVDGGNFIRWNDIPGSSNWQWDDLHNSDAGGSVVQLNLAEGAHTIVIANRENGISIDKFYLTSQGDTPSGIGGQGGSCSGPSCTDTDGDGVFDAHDQCAGTAPGTPVDAAGCPISTNDSDDDGVLDQHDLCPNSPPGAVVDQHGCVDLDLDGDGVSDFDDQCPDTAANAPVDIYGCAISDADGDGVIDLDDECPDTPPGTPVNLSGCPIDESVPEWNGPPPPDSDFDSVTLANGINEPMEVEIASNGQIYIIGRRGEFYAIENGSLNQKAMFETNSFAEGGLIGFVLDPNFAANRFAYFHYTHGTQAHNVISRIPINTNNTPNFAAESVLLTYGIQLAECCHSAGEMEFGPDGNLYISTGDNTPASDYAPIDERPGRSVYDAQKSSSNTNDLRGKILRITPTPSGGYTIPSGNLFAADATHRGEIFVMGNRNPFRIALDSETGELFWGEVGPDANGSSATRGPAGYDEINRTLTAGNFGWPYITGFNEPYNDFNYQTNSSGPLFNPNNLVNNSPNNTGALNLPNAQPAWVRLSHRATMVGGVYRWDPSIDDPYKLPSYFHGRLLYWNFNNDQMFEAPIDTSSPTLRQWLNTAPLDGIIDATFSPHNGRLYLLGYGGNCCNMPAFAGMLVEVGYIGEEGEQEAADEYAINTAGSSYVAQDGTTFMADALYSGGSVSTDSAAISGTADPALYQTHRWQAGGFSYALPLVNDDYEVTLKFAETYFNQSGQRSFHVDAEGVRVISSLDVYSVVGADAAHDETFNVSVADGVLNLNFVPEVENPFISAIVVKKASTFTFGSNISLQAGINGKYVSANGASVFANASSVGNGETFTIVDGGAGTIAFRSLASGLHLSVASDDGATLSATASGIGVSERFQLIENAGGYYVIRAAVNDAYVTASQAGAGPLAASSTTIGGWQVFQVSPVHVCEPSVDHGVACRPQAAPYLNMPVGPSPTFNNVPTLLSQTGAFANVSQLVPSSSMIPFEPITALWSDRASKLRWVSVPSGSKITWAESGKWAFPAGTVFVKHFELPIDEDNSLLTKRLETRLLIVQPGGSVYGVTYKWRNDNSDADLLTTILEEPISIASSGGNWIQTWTYPSPSDCVSCHNSEAKGVLGAKTASLNGPWEYPSGVTDNQLRTWSHLGLFDQVLDESQLGGFPAHASLTDTGASVEHRLRSYWDINCGQCHGPLGIAALWDARFETPLEEQGIINGALANQRDYFADYGLDDPFVVDPGNPANSILYIRDASEDTYDRMPPLARALRDDDYLTLLEQWINGL